MNQLIRVLLPSWRFFDGLVDAPVLLHRTSNDKKNFSEWIQTLPKAGPRSWKNLFLNSRENYLFAAHALLEYFKNDLQEGSDSTVSLELVQNLVKFQISSIKPEENAHFFQFKMISEAAEYYSPTLEFKK